PCVVVRRHARGGQGRGHAQLGLDQVPAVRRGVVGGAAGDEQDPSTTGHGVAHLLGPPAYLVQRGRHRLALLGDLATHPRLLHYWTIPICAIPLRLLTRRTLG